MLSLDVWASERPSWLYPCRFRTGLVAHMYMKGKVPLVTPHSSLLNPTTKGSFCGWAEAYTFQVNQHF